VKEVLRPSNAKRLYMDEVRRSMDHGLRG